MCFRQRRQLLVYIILLRLTLGASVHRLTLFTKPSFALAGSTDINGIP